MSHMLKLKLGFELIWGGPLDPEVEPSFANIFAFIDKLIKLKIMSIYITLNNRIMIVSIKLIC